MGNWKPVNWLPGKMILYIGRVEICPVCICCVCACVYVSCVALYVVYIYVLCVCVCCMYVCCVTTSVCSVCAYCVCVCWACVVCVHTLGGRYAQAGPCARVLSVLTQQLAWKSASLVPGPQTHPSNIRQVSLERLCPSDPQVPITPLALAVHGCSRHLLSLCPLQSQHPPREMPT